MRTSFIVTCACAAGLAFCSLANAQNEGRPGWPAGPSKQAANQNDGRPGWKADSSSFVDKLYFTTDVGINWMPDVKLDDIGDSAVLNGVVNAFTFTNLKYKTEVGMRWDYGIGYNFTSNFRVQFESGILSNNIDNWSGTLTANLPFFGLNPFTVSGDITDLPGVTYSGKMVQIPFMFAGIYDFNVGDGDRTDKSASASWRFRPYVGAGVGTVYIDNTSKVRGLGSELDLGGRDWVLAYQAMVGLEYQVADNWFLSIGYRFLGLTAADFGRPKLNGAELTALNGNINVKSKAIYNHSLQFGLRIDF